MLWSPQRLALYQHLATFAERIGLIVALQSKGKISWESAYTEIRSIWNERKDSNSQLLLNHAPPALP